MSAASPVPAQQQPQNSNDLYKITCKTYLVCLLSLSRAFLQVLVGVRFLRQWPFIGRVRVCFVEPPYFQMTVKPLFGHGLDVTELPGISGWLVSLSSLVYCFHLAKKIFYFPLTF